MIIYGTGEKKLSSPTQFVRSRCPQCGEQEVTFHFFKKYFHLFWLPMFPYGSRNVAFCEKCHAGFEISFPPDLKFEMQNAKSRTSTPITMFTGTILLVMGISAIVYFDDGMDTYYYPSNKKQAMGRLVNDKEDGKWTFWFENGNLKSEQYYKNGVQDSVWIWYTEAGTKEKEGGYRNGMYEGRWAFYYPSGALQEEYSCHGNRKYGKSTYYYESGQKAGEGEFLRDREHGPWTFWYENGNVLTEGSFEDGIKSGIWKSYYENNNLESETRFADSTSYIISYFSPEGKQEVTNGNGVYTTYYPNGLQSGTGQVRDGLNAGKWSFFYSDGKLKEQGTFSKGEFTLISSWEPDGKPGVVDGGGYYRNYLENGVVGSECLYKNGKPHGLLLARNENNMTVSELTYEEGVLNGQARYYNASGTVDGEGMIMGGKHEGMWVWYHLNGTKSSEAKFVNGNKEGEQIFWSESGDVVKREFYKDGNLEREETYQ